MNLRKLMAATAIVATMMAATAPVTMAEEAKSEETASTCPLAGVCTAVTGTIDGLFTAIGGVFGGGK